MKFVNCTQARHALSHIEIGNLRRPRQSKHSAANDSNMRGTTQVFCRLSLKCDVPLRGEFPPSRDPDHQAFGQRSSCLSLIGDVSRLGQTLPFLPTLDAGGDAVVQHLE
jgi:hypothetical protein